MRNALHFLLITTVIISSTTFTVNGQQIVSRCPECYNNQPSPHYTDTITNGQGQQRKRIFVRIDQSFGATTPANIWNAVEGCAGCDPGALKMWNDAGKDFHFQLKQSYGLLQQPDVEIILADSWPDDNTCAVTVIDRSETAPRPRIYLPRAALGWNPRYLAALIAHEIGHALGLANLWRKGFALPPDCSSIMDRSYGGCGVNRNTYFVTRQDGERAHEQFLDRKTNCRANSDDDTLSDGSSTGGGGSGPGGQTCVPHTEVYCQYYDYVERYCYSYATRTTYVCQ